MRNTIVSSFSHKFFTALAISAMVLMALPAAPAYAAATITVTTTDDQYNDGVTPACSLREAIALANSNATNLYGCSRSNADVDDIIVLQSGLTYTLTRAGLGSTALGDLDIAAAGGTSGNLTIEASGSTPAVIDASGLTLGGTPDRILDVSAPGNTSLTLTRITLTNGDTTGQLTSTAGGGLSFAGTGALTLTNSTVSDNVSANDAGCGGGIYNNSAATVIITDSTIEGNSCPTAGSDGGGLFKGGGGTLTITGSTISNNSTAENGGGVHIAAGTSTITTAITNSTFANNTAGNRGGGLQVGGTTAVVTVDFSTFSGNIANEETVVGGLNGGGALQVSLGIVTVTRSILADSLVTLGQVGTPKDCDQAGAPTVSITDSIIENNNDCVASFTSGDPQLVALTDNGGPTQTMAIPVSSPAYNTADNCGSATTDQRGFTRPQVGACDLGAYEVQNAAAPTVLSVVRGANPDPTNDPAVDFIVTFSESVIGVDATDFSPIMTGVTGATVSEVSGSGTTWTVTVNTGTGDGTIRLDVLDDNTIIGGADPLDGGFTTGEVYTVDKTAPTVSITRADNETMGTATVDFGVSFSEAVTGVDAVDFTLVPTGVTGASISGLSGLGNTYTVTVNTGSGDGAIGLDLDNSGTGIVDAAGNTIIGGSTGEIYTILKSAALVDVNIAATTVGNDINIPLHNGARQNFAVDNGPAQVVSTNGLDIITALRVIWKEPGFRSSYSEMMGLPVEQLSSEYWFPWYNNLSTTAMDQGFRIANVDDTDTTVKVFIAGSEVDSFTLIAGQSVRKNYLIDNGPVQIFSTDGTTKILAALRVIWKEPGFRSSYSEMMGLPVEQLSDEYWFPWYNNLSTTAMDQGFRIANLDNTSHTIKVIIAGTEEASFSLGAGVSTRVNYPVDNGPAQILCSDCGVNDKIIAALRVIWKEPGFRSSYSEMMGLPVEQLSDEYWFPWYNNLSTTAMDQGFRIANLDNTSHTIKVIIAGTEEASFSLGAGVSTRVNYPVDNGPAQILCSDCGVNDKIIAALRVIWKEPGRYSYSEMMGLPTEALSTEYWFPWYNNAFPATMDQGFRISAR